MASLYTKKAAPEEAPIVITSRGQHKHQHPPDLAKLCRNTSRDTVLKQAVTDSSLRPRHLFGILSNNVTMQGEVVTTSPQALARAISRERVKEVAAPTTL